MPIDLPVISKNRKIFNQAMKIRKNFVANQMIKNQNQPESRPSISEEKYFINRELQSPNM